ncbi:asparagine synthase (glutamine-hydrolyzing) [Halalkalibacillus sediminis]|uniref:asparagine synthase (glutamine-hydrolyzing) n=1 Tax=Halalkalibacillus sediminis TaxID=2018042 RepID=A0A2I0QRY6_9BACI|nr:asparagine synthase (glutamine-hydrolyzing) [Halalkalibacillus sediminis]PKR77096.1 asparagine synthase (glutamine-hydrolyzing) [Halalkalibacillus sediminis]
MCGLTGWVSWNGVQPDQYSMLKQMTATITHRGTDDEGYYMNEHVAFGHRRLAIIDVEKGKQPMKRMIDHDEYMIIYNGELYNTEELRRSLKSQGYTFNTTCDTEVLLCAYIHWGEDCLDHLNGIFAFVIWDSSKEQVFIARDRLGVKPLYYAEKGKNLIFGSEVKAILAHSAVDPVVDRDGLAEIFGLGPSSTPGHAIFKQVKELRAGHAMIFSKNGLKSWRYWNVESHPHEDSFEETVEKVRFLLTDAIERQLVSDVPLSTFLSGGLDSSAITAIAARRFEKDHRGQLSTFSIDYEGNEKYFKKNEFQPSSDREFIQKMVQKFETKHHDERISENELAELLKRSVELRDLPGMADIDSSLLWFCQRVKQHTSVSLSGECADEIFGGYPWFEEPTLSQADSFPWIRSLEGRENLLHDEWKDRLSIKDYVHQRFQETMDESPKLEGESAADAKRRQMFYLNMHWFMAQLLERKDRMSMGATLEVRVPFADHRLIQYVWNVPWEMKRVGGYEKGLLRKAMEGVLPDEVLYRKKNPYPKTFQPEYTRLVNEWAKKILLHKDARIHEFLNKKRLEELIDTDGKAFSTPWYGQLMAGPQLIAHLCQIEYWLSTYGVTTEG